MAVVDKMKEKIKEYIYEGNYHLAEVICENMALCDVKDTILILAYDTESICIYSFIRYMISKSNSPVWIELAVDVLVYPLCYVEGAYSTALFHARELLKLEYSVKNLELILFFYDIPEKLVKRSEALSISKEILNMESDNKIALRISGD